ncbi:hypothetical protein MCUN1_002726 [Malassezia cuniculi]|uniref:Uncharacterized protein n=1 Tax=Malassezia cuniculi TaxID=948313 RepID=A0AAF0F084_9BASI|nr:hypothetical protein MCUN1_002726 [Malassezia cuniculi]
MSKRAAPPRDAPSKKTPRIPGFKRDPTRSIYYDPVFNPYGAPPPGMPYRERGTPHANRPALTPHSSDDEIVMPQGPAPPEARIYDSDSSDDDDIALPAGPAPASASAPTLPAPPPAIMAKRVGVVLSSDAVAYDKDEQERIHAQDTSATESAMSAAPQMRDIKKEVTSFVPPSVRRRQKSSTTAQQH